jgi:lipopolysaccharide export system protein LptA
MKRRLFFSIIVLMASAPAIVAAQTPRPGSVAPQLSNPAQGILNDNQDQPIQIDAATLEVRDKEKMATFAGDVQVVQGDTTIKCQKLVVYYGPEPGSAAAAAQAKRQQQQPQPQSQSQSQSQSQAQQPQPTGGLPARQQDIRRIEALGGVTVISKDQTASGDRGVYDLKTKTITLVHNVTVAQGKNVLHGERVVVDTVSGNAHFDSIADAQNGTAAAKPPGRVRAVILPNKDTKGGAPTNTPTNTLPIGPAGGLTPAKPN